MTPALKLATSILFMGSSTLFMGFMGSSILFSGGSAQAQNINGIFSPRSSERFFQDGITQLEQSIEQLQTPHPDEAEPLRIDGSVEEQLQDLERDGKGNRVDINDG